MTISNVIKALKERKEMYCDAEVIFRNSDEDEDIAILSVYFDEDANRAIVSNAFDPFD